MTAYRLPLFLSFAALVLFLLIGRPWGLYFLCDDFAHVPEASDANLFQTHLLRPLANLSLWADYQLWHFNATGYHATNIVLHLLNTVVLFFLGRELQNQLGSEQANDNLLPLFASLLFLVYAFHSEPVFWIVGRGGSLCALFLQLGLFFFLKQNGLSLLFALAFFVLALFTYELSWSFPLLCAVLWLYGRLAGKKVGSLIGVVLTWCLFGLYLWYRFHWLNYPLPYGTSTMFSGQNFFTLVRNGGALIARLFVPPLQSSKIFMAFVVLVAGAILALLFSLWRKSKPAFHRALLLLVCSVISILPVISLGIDTHDTESERFIYPASAFVCLFIVDLLSSLLTQRKILYLLLTFLISLNLYGFYHSSNAYRYASNVSQQVVNALNKHPAVRDLTLINLPSQYKGALLFRIGFVVNKPGILHTTYRSIKLVSLNEITEPVQYSVIDRYGSSSRPRLTVEFAGDRILLY